MNRPEPEHFDAPWQAQAFAMAVAASEAGLFTWSEWSERLGARLNGPGTAQDGSDYYEHWLATFEELLGEKAGIAGEEVERLTEDWQEAARRTPHGTPIELSVLTRGE